MAMFLQSFVVNGLLISLAILVHYEMLRWLSIGIPKLPTRHRLKVVTGRLGALTAHVIEIWMFGIGYYFLIETGRSGARDLDGVFHVYRNAEILG
jgi:hypothetical protein